MFKLKVIPLLNFLRWRNVIMNMKKPILAAAALLGIAGITAVALKAQDKPLATVPKVDLEKYLGKWYEIAAFPQSFKKVAAAHQPYTV